MRFRNISIRSKVSWGVLLVFLLAMTLASLGIFFFQAATFQKRGISELRTLAKLAEPNLNAEILVGTPVGAANVLSRMIRESDLSESYLFTLPDGELFARSPADAPLPAPISSTTDGERIERDGIWVARTLRDEKGNPFARLILHSRMETLRKEQNQYRLLLAALALVLGTVSVILAHFFRRSLTGPLSALAATMNRVAREGAIGIRAEKGGEDEVGQLADHFNGMLAALAGSSRALSQSEQRFRTLIERAPVAIAISRELNLVYANPAFVAMYGFDSAQELIGSPIQDRVAAQSRVEFAARAERREQGRSAETVYEVVGLRKNGAEFHVRAAVTLVELNDGPAVVGFFHDITERKWAEETMRLSQAQLLANLENTPNVAVQWYDDAGRILFWNPASEALYGWKSAEVLGKTLDALIHTPEEAAEFLRILHGIRETGQAFGPYEAHIRTRDGTPGWVLATTFGMPMGEGRMGFVCMDVDITQRKKAEEALRSSEQRLSLALEATGAGVWEVDLRTGRVAIDPRSIAALGYSPDEVSTRMEDWTALQHPEDNARTSPAFQALLRGETKLYSAEHRTRRKDGTWSWSASRGIIAERTPEGVPVRVLGTNININARKQAEQALRDSETRYRSLVEGMRDIVFNVDVHGVILFVGPQVRQYGYTMEEIVGRRFVDFVFEADREALVRDFQANFTVGEDRQSTFRILTKDNTVAWVEETGTVVRDDAGRLTGISGILRDVTERKRAEEEKQALQVQLIQAQKMEAIGQLAGGVAHDFNNILTAILMQLSLLREERALSPEVQAGLRDLEGEAKRAAGLTRQLLMFSRRQVLQSQKLDLNSLLGNLLKMLRRLIGEDIQLEFSGSAGDLWMEADQGMLEQVVMNLVVNARDAMPSGGTVTLRTRLAVIDPEAARRNPEARPGRFVCLAITDTGCGMNDATVKRLFEPFFTTKEAGKGTGLGLATVFGIVKQHQGWIEVHTELGHGSTFEVFLPVADPPAVVAVSPETLHAAPRGQETLLVVEDETSVRRTIASALRQLGYQIHEAGNGPAALAAWETHRHTVALVITDVVMPGGVSGLDLVEQLLHRQPDLKAILISGYSLEMARHGLPKHDAVRFLQKPFEAATLARLVRECLDAR